MQKKKGIINRYFFFFKRSLLVVSFLFCISLLIGCSTRRNTAGKRFYQALTTKFNVYYNGNEAYKAGCLALEEGNKDNYMEMISLYPIGNNTSVGIGSGDFDRAIEKAQKAIALHSIKRKPIRKPGKLYTDSYKEWLNRKEFNPYLYHAWLLLGKAQYQKGDFPEAAATFSYVSRLYATQPKIVAEARIWLARCYTQSGWYYDAEEVLLKVDNDTLPYYLVPQYATAYGDYLVGSERYREAIPYLITTVKNEKKRLQRARQYYLLGQLYQSLNDPTNAFIAYGKVIKQNPLYELELNARIRQTEVAVMQTAHDPAAMKRITDKVRRMTKSEKNKEYLDQLYYAMGNIFMSAKDTLQAIKSYQTGVEKSTRGGIEKGIIQLTLGNLFWQRGNYPDAQKAYTEAIALLDKTHDEYNETTLRSVTLDELVPYIETIVLQDSLQRLAALDSVSRMHIIDEIIEGVKQKERDELAVQLETERMNGRDEMTSTLEGGPDSRPTTPTHLPANDDSWYFYNQQALNQGKNDFQRQWGKRKSEDNWRRRNKTVVVLDEFEAINYDENKDAAEIAESNKSVIAPANGQEGVTDEKHPSFYLRQIPLTADAMRLSDELLCEGLFHAAIILKDKVENYNRAEVHFKRLFEEFPNYSSLDKAYYNYFLMMGRIGRIDESDRAKMELTARFPKSNYTLMINDPDYAYNAVHGKRLEDSLYAATYSAYQKGDYTEVTNNATLSANRYPMGWHRPKFIFLKAATALQNGHQKLFLSELKTLVQNYPENEISDLAAHILKGVQEGRLLASGSASFGTIWSRRNEESDQEENIVADADSMPQFSTERQTPYLFVLAYPEGKIDENSLLYEMARYNFSTFMVKNFDFDIQTERGIGRFIVSEFNNLNEALYYRRQLYADAHMNEKLNGLRAVIISKENYELLNRLYSFDDYDTFFEENWGEKSEHPLINNVEIDGTTLDDPILTLPLQEENEEESDDEEEEIEDDGSMYVF